MVEWGKMPVNIHSPDSGNICASLNLCILYQRHSQDEVLFRTRGFRPSMAEPQQRETMTTATMPAKAIGYRDKCLQIKKNLPRDWRVEEDNRYSG